MKFFMVLVLACVAMLSAGTADVLPVGPHTLCGRTLAEARKLYCFGIGVGVESVHKRYQNYDDLPFLGNSIEDTLPWLSRWPAAQAKALESRSKRAGLVDECCFKPCYISELLEYC